MKYKIVGWCEYDCNDFKEMPYLSNNAYLTLIREIRDKGYEISGYDHQENGWVPVFNTGEIVTFSQRAWGKIMIDACQFEQKDEYAYAIYGVGGAVMGYNDNTIYDKSKAEFPNIEDICDYYQIVISKSSYESYLDGNNVFRFFINKEIDSVDPHDRILLRFQNNIIETEVLGRFTGRHDATENLIKVCLECEYEEETSDEDFEEEPVEKKEYRMLAIVEPDYQYYERNNDKKALALRVIKEYKVESDS